MKTGDSVGMMLFDLHMCFLEEDRRIIGTRDGAQRMWWNLPATDLYLRS